jgi:hypothetical protein
MKTGLFAGVTSIVIFVAVLVAASIISAYPTMWLVNYLFAPSLLLLVFGVAHVGLWKALAINLFSGLLVKSSNSSSSK